MKNRKKQSKRQARNYSFVALILAALAAVAALLLGITRGLVSMQVFTVANVDNLQRGLFISIGLVVLFLAAYSIMEPDKVRRFFSGRQARYGSNALIMTLAFLGILVVGNVLAYQNPKTLVDLTEDKANTLSPEMTNALNALPAKVTATAFFSQNSSTDSAEKLLSNIKANSGGKFDFSFINPDRDPQTVRDAGITGDGKILLQMDSYKEIVPFASETEILKGFLRLLNPGNNVVYFLTGHGERDIEQAGESALTRAKGTLEDKNYTVKTLNLLAENQIPEDASVVVIAGPIKPVSENEVNLLKDYLAQGGSLIVMVDPTILTEFGDESDPLAEMLAKDWGIILNNDVVIDLNNPDPRTAVSALYDSSHVVTRNMNRVGALFPYTRSLSVADAPEGITNTRLVQTNENSWAETDFESLKQEGWPPSFDVSTESQGPLTLVAAGENLSSGGRVVVFGTSAFAEDQRFDGMGNGDMLINSVDWAAEQEDLPNITPKMPTERRFTAPGQFQWIAILLGSIFIIPGLVILAGVSTWLKRRRQG